MNRWKPSAGHRYEYLASVRWNDVAFETKFTATADLMCIDGNLCVYWYILIGNYYGNGFKRCETAAHSVMVERGWTCHHLLLRITFVRYAFCSVIFDLSYHQYQKLFAWNARQQAHGIPVQYRCCNIIACAMQSNGPCKTRSTRTALTVIRITQIWRAPATATAAQRLLREID